MISALIVAAGRGRRMGSEQDKLFLSLAGEPVIAHTWRGLDRTPELDEIVLVVRPATRAAFSALGRASHFQKPFQLIDGGEERQDSVWNGLNALSAQSEIVVIQDGARPLVNPATVSATIVAARQVGAAVTAQRVTDTIKECGEGQLIRRHLDRSVLWAVQTPQTFQVAIIREALARVRAQGLSLTDDTAACEFIKQPVKLVESLLPNPKVTLPGDLPWIEWILGNRAA